MKRGKSKSYRHSRKMWAKEENNVRFGIILLRAKYPEFCSLQYGSQLDAFASAAGVWLPADTYKPHLKALVVLAVLAPKHNIQIPTIRMQTKELLLDLALGIGLDKALFEAYPTYGAFSAKKPEVPKPKKGRGNKKRDDAISRFYKGFEWKRLRYEALKNSGRKCSLCNRSDGVLNVDHIKPVRKYWDLRYDPKNLQVLCSTCNHGKGSWDETDWRAKEATNVVPFKRLRLPPGA